MSSLSPEKALIFRITHIANVPWILSNGLHCRRSAMQDPDYVEIGNQDLIDKRTHRVVPIPPGGTLSDYVPFYFTPYSPMLYNIKTGRGVAQRAMTDIVIIVSSLPTLTANGVQFVFTDRHAYLQNATFSNQLGALNDLDWKLWQARDFRRDPNDPGKFERYNAEALAHQHVPIAAIQGLVCYRTEQEPILKELVHNSNAAPTVMSRPGWYL